jgi:hypothetical protein
MRRIKAERAHEDFETQTAPDVAMDVMSELVRQHDSYLII